MQCRQVLEENARAVRNADMQRKQLAEMERIHVTEGASDRSGCVTVKPPYSGSCLPLPLPPTINIAIELL